MSDGRISLRSRMRIFMALALCGVMLVVCAFASLFFVRIEDTVIAGGRIVPAESYEIVGYIDARILKVLHEEGDDVGQGELVAILDSSEFQEDAASLASAIKELEAELNVRKASLATLEKEPLPSELWHSDTNLKECEGKTEKARERVERSRRLVSLGAISKVALEKDEVELIKCEAELERARENSKKVAEGLALKIVEKARCDVALVKAKLDGKRKELEVCKSRMADCKLVSPAAGRLVELPCKSVMYVQKGLVAARVASGGAVKALANVDEGVVRKIRPGQNARIASGIYSSLKYGSFPAVVERVCDIPVSEGGMTRYQVELFVEPKEGRELKIGSSAEIAIVSGIRPAIYAFLNIGD